MLKDAKAAATSLDAHVALVGRTNARAEASLVADRERDSRKEAQKRQRQLADSLETGHHTVALPCIHATVSACQDSLEMTILDPSALTTAHYEKPFVLNGGDLFSA